MQSVTNFLPRPPSSKLDAGADRPQPGPAATGDGGDFPHHYLKRFSKIVAMIEFLDRLPDRAPDAPDWALHSDSEGIAGRPDRQNDESVGAFAALDPLMRRSLEAVAAGLDKLAESAADLCDPRRKSLTPGELESCVEISRSMRRLLDRASALIESPETQDIDAAPAPSSGPSRQNDARSPLKQGEPRIARS
jgi:hypothetical protein